MIFGTFPHRLNIRKLPLSGTTSHCAEWWCEEIVSWRHNAFNVPSPCWFTACQHCSDVCCCFLGIVAPFCSPSLMSSFIRRWTEWDWIDWTAFKNLFFQRCNCANSLKGYEGKRNGIVQFSLHSFRWWWDGARLPPCGLGAEAKLISVRLHLFPVYCGTDPKWLHQTKFNSFFCVVASSAWFYKH